MAVRIGIIGVGAMGSQHAQQLAAGKHPRLQLTALCDPVPQRLAGFPDIPHFHDSAALIRSGLVDAVLVATPHYLHTTIGIDALEQGLHLLVEKPISVHVEDCQRLIAAYAARPKPSQVFAAMFNERTIGRNQKIRELIHSGELGRINRVAWITTDWFRSETYYRSGGWRATWGGEGGGVLTNQCPHRLDLLQWWFGRPEKIHAFAGFGRHHDIEVEDDVTAHLSWANGTTGVFITTTGECPGVNRLEIAAERGLVVVEGESIRFQRNAVETTAWSRTTTSRMQGPEVWDIAIPIPKVPAGHGVIIDNFAAAILDGTPLIAPAGEGIAAVEIANAIILSAKAGKTVSLPLDVHEYSRLHADLVANSRYRPEVQDVVSITSAAEMAASFGR